MSLAKPTHYNILSPFSKSMVIATNILAEEKIVKKGNRTRERGFVIFRE
jgi:hypothetical protein